MDGHVEGAEFFSISLRCFSTLFPLSSPLSDGSVTPCPAWKPQSLIFPYIYSIRNGWNVNSLVRTPARHRSVSCVRTRLYALFPHLWSLVRATSTEITTFLLASAEKFHSTLCSCSTTDGINDNVITVKSSVQRGRNYFQLRDYVLSMYTV